MYVCICAGTTANEVNAAIALGARTVEAVGDGCEAGTGCGSCHERIGELLTAARRRREVGCCGTGCGAFCVPSAVSGTVAG